MSEKPLISYVIGVRNMEATVGKAIESIINQDYPNKEVIVVNDGSDDSTEEVLKKYPIKIINTEKIGISNARNLGYKNSRGFFVAFTDADCELDPLWTINMLDCFNNGEVGLVGGITYYKRDGTYCSIYRNLEFLKRYKNIKTKEVFHACGAGFILKRSVLDKIGGFNPEWVHAEDIEISFLTIKHGYKVLKQDSAIAFHIPENNFKRIIRKALRDSKAYVRVAKNHPKSSLYNKFHHTWYFRYDLIILSISYAFLFLSAFSFPILYLLNRYLFQTSIIISLLNIWLWTIIFICIFLFIYGLIPSCQVFINSKTKKIKYLFGTLSIHHSRGFAWGIGLILGIKNIIFKR